MAAAHSTTISSPGEKGRSSLIPQAAAFYLLASITVSFLAGSMAPTPLYPIYQAEWGFSALTVTEIFSIYAIALLGSLLVFGRLSDHIGRRPVLIVATFVQALTMLLFINAGSPEGLLLARLVQGLATGAALGAVGAGMIDVNKTLGPVANAIAPMMGTASGGLVAGLMVHYLPAPTTLVYLTLAVVFLAQMIGVVLMAETAVLRAGAAASLVPQVGLPAIARRQMALAVPVLIAAWSLAGFYGSLGPAITHSVFGFDASVGGGLMAFTLASSGVLTVYLTQRLSPRTVKIYGAFGLLTGAAVSVLSLALHSPTVFLIGTAIAGSGFGGGFQGAVRSVIPLAHADERAGVLSVIFIVSYLAMGLPAIAAGLFVARWGDLTLTAQIFGGVVAGLAVLALIGEVSGRKEIASSVPKLV